MEVFRTTNGCPWQGILSASLAGRSSFRRTKPHGQKSPISPPARPLPISAHHQTAPINELPASRRGLLGLIASFPLAVSVAEDASPATAAFTSCDLTVAPSGLAFCDILPGSGSPASKGMVIKANYVGKLVDGKVFDSSYDRGKPFTFKVGVGQVIKGWDEGILGGEGIPPMLAGGKRTLRIPPTLGYGERGAGCRGGTSIWMAFTFVKAHY